MRLLLFTGKGGAGTTTLAAAGAVHAARCGIKTLLLGVDDDGALAEVLTEEAAAESALTVQSTPGFPAAQAQDAVRAVLDQAGVDPVPADLIGVLPGAEEVSVLLAVRDAVVQGPWDLVICDLGPTRSALRLLDLREHRSLAEVPLQPDLVYPAYTTQFLDHGIYVSFDAETAEGTLQGIRLTYLHATGVLARLDEAEPAYTVCNDLLADGSILCWHFADWTTVDVEFARYDPSWSSSTVLLDEHVYLEVVP